MKGQKLKEFKGTEIVDGKSRSDKKLHRLSDGFEGLFEMGKMNL